MKKVLQTKINVLDAKTGIVEYVASDESVDRDREILKADGWRFDNFQKNSPFLDSHDYSTVENALGKVVDARVENKQLINTVQWAIDVPENKKAALGFKMTQAGYLNAVSVGFAPVRAITAKSDPKNFRATLQTLGIADASKVDRIFLEQQQFELSAVLIGANPNAVAKGYKAGIISDDDLELFSSMRAKIETASSTDDPADVEQARQRAKMAFLMEFHIKLNKI